MKIRALVVSAFLLVACSQSDEDRKKEEEQKQIDQLAAQKAAQLEADRQAKEDAAQVEISKIADDKLNQQAQAEEEREKIAADLAQREASQQAGRAAKIEAAMTEKARREAVAASVTGYVDSLNIGSNGDANGNRVFYISSKEAKKGLMFLSPEGYTVTYDGRDGDYFLFDYDDSNFAVFLKRTSDGVSLATIKNKTALAEGISDSDIPSSPIGLSPEDAAGGIYIMKATWGANDKQPDVKDIVKSKISNGRLQFSANSSDLGGDPCFGQVKTFYIKYLYQGKIVEKSFREGDQVSLP